MPSSYEYHLLDEKELKVGERKRKEFKGIEELANSIERLGLLNPLVVQRDGSLVAGERRLRALRVLGERFPKWPFVPVHYVDELDEGELHAIELEENLRRADLTWDEDATGHLEFFEYLESRDAETSVETVAESIGVSDRYLRRRLSVGRAIREGHPLVLECESIGQAENILQRERGRAVQVEIDKFAAASLAEQAPVELASQPPQASGIEGKAKPQAAPVGAAESVLNEDFNEWAPNYSGPLFNFIHCDFPYGINHQKSAQGSSKRRGAYEDSEDTYWALIETLLKNADRLMSPNTHLLFWFSMNHYLETCAAFTKEGFNVNPFPLIWVKSDNTGILPDAQRGPRRIYETALLITRGDRRVVKPVANATLAAASKRTAQHLSEKPSIMLLHFLRMLVDSSTHALDPTCGGGSALQVALQLGAARVVGLDVDAEHCETARLRVSEILTSRAFSQRIKEQVEAEG